MGKAQPSFRKQCGTSTGYSLHYKNNEYACSPCVRARASYVTARSIRNGTVKSITIPVDILAEIFSRSHYQTKAILLRHLGNDVMKALRDHYNDRYPRT